MAKSITNEKLTDIFAKSAEDAGMGNISVKAEFSEMKDFKVTWTRSMSAMEIAVSDYLKRAPVKVVKDIADTIFNRIQGGDAAYSDTVTDYLSSEDFATQNQKKWMARRHVDKTADNSMLMELLDELCADGWYRPVAGQCVAWNPKNNKYGGETTVTMRTMLINPALSHASRCTTKYALYEQAAVLEEGFNKYGRYKGDVYQHKLKDYLGSLTGEERNTIADEYTDFHISFM